MMQEEYQVPKRISAAVVGHGPSLEGAGWGPQIDKHDLVIRMVECDWQPKADYGQKYDIGVYLRGYPVNVMSQMKRIPAIAYWTVTLEREEEHLPDTIVGVYQHRTIVQIRQSFWGPWEETKRRKGRARHGSRGGIAAIAVLQRFPVRRLSLFGLDAIRDRVDVKRRADEASGNINQRKALTGYYPTKQVPRCPHDWQRERRVIKQVAQEHETEVVYV